MKTIRTVCGFSWVNTLLIARQYGIDPYDFKLDKSAGLEVYINETEEYVDIYIDLTYKSNLEQDELFDYFLLGVGTFYAVKYGWQMNPLFASLPEGNISDEDIMRIERLSR